MSVVSAPLNGFAVPASSARSEGHSFFARIFKAVGESRMRAAEREIARLIELRGGRMSDDLERQIERHFV